jgi:hypothetical protein
VSFLVVVTRQPMTCSTRVPFNRLTSLSSSHETTVVNRGGRAFGLMGEIYETNPGVKVKLRDSKATGLLAGLSVTDWLNSCHHYL